MSVKSIVIPSENYTGYEQGIIYSLGTWDGGRTVVRCVDEFYPKYLEKLFGTKTYSQILPEREKKQYIIKSTRIQNVSLRDVKDPVAFIRAYAEIHGNITPVTQHHKNGKVHVIGFKIYGQEEVLEYIMSFSPVLRKKPCEIKTNMDGGYTGKTYSITFQKRETETFLNFIDGYPKNESVWGKWDNKKGYILKMDIE